MGRKALFAAICWLAISEALGDKSTVKSSVAIDNESAESAPRLYRNVPVGVYASAVPYGSYSFHLPRFIAAPHAAASQIVPVKQDANHGFLKDSYGNKFVETHSPLTLGYKTAFPQEFLPLQKLPDHLAQPLVGASANFQFKQTGPQVFVGSPYRVPALQGPTPTPINQFPGFSQPLVYAEKVRSLAPSENNFGLHSAQQQSTNNKAVFASAHPYEHFSSFKSEPKFQRIQDIPRLVYGEPKYQIIQEIPKLPYGENKFQRLKEAPSVHREEHQFERYEETPAQNQAHDDNAPLQAVPAKKIVTYVSDVNGKTTVVKLKTDPPVPLIDLTLLEPLTFDNPLVPQVQHFLPRIHQATYEKLPQAVPQAKTYDIRKGKSSTPKKAKKPINNKPKQTPVTHHETLDEVPEISYEINQPNYQETYKEKALSYNKETTSAPVHYSYGSKTENEPVTYSYSRSSVEPHNEEIRFEHPKHLIYNLSPEEQSDEKEEVQNHPEEEEEEEESESQRETSHESGDDDSYHPHPEQYNEKTNAEEHHELQNDEKEQHQKQTHQKQQQETPPDVEVFNSETNYPPSQQKSVKNYEQFQPITREYEEIRLAPTPSAAIKVDPKQHVHQAKPTQQPHPSPSPHHEEHSPAPHRHPHPSASPQQHLQHSQNSHPHPSPIQKSYNHEHYSSPPSDRHNVPASQIHEKSKRIIIKEETPESMHMLAEKMREEMIEREENSEEDFEKAYKDAAIGFPTYKASEDVEKEIFNPESYGVPPEHIEYSIENTPFQQYQDQSDDYPKTTRLSYKDARDKTKENYYADYKVSKPESLHNRYRNKENYYKSYRDNKPDYLENDREDDKKKQQPKSAKYTAAPSHDYPSQQKVKSYYGSYQPKQQLYDYDYSKGVPRDNSAFASRPLRIYKLKTNFVEPQFQYGFEPISIPKLLDSELAAMASNLSPESEKPGMRKKIYKENWYIKQTSMSAGDPAS